MKVCTNCGAQLPEGVKFCTECGTKFEAEAPVQETPAEPVYEAPAAPAEPAYEEPAEPAYEEPAEPAYEVPVEPAYEVPVEPAYEVSAEPAYEAPAEPAYTPPVKQTVPQKKKKSLLPVLIGAAAVVIALISLLVFCSGKDQGKEADWGLYEGVSCVYEGFDVGADGEWIELQKKGKATICLMGEEIGCRWLLDGKKFTLKQGGTEYYGTLENGVLSFDLEGIVYTYEKKGGAPAGLTSGEDKDEPSELSCWEGDYYGWWVIDSVWEGEDFEEGDWWDCCATIELDEDGTGTMILWDEDMPKDDPLAEMGITVTVDGNGVARFCSEEGWFLSDEMEHADWVFYSDATEYGDVLYIDGEYEDGTYDFWYNIYLRPWGTDWSDVAENEPEDIPYYYENWYLPLIEDGVTEAPGTIG